MIFYGTEISISEEFPSKGFTDQHTFILLYVKVFLLLNKLSIFIFEFNLSFLGNLFILKILASKKGDASPFLVYYFLVLFLLFDFVI